MGGRSAYYDGTVNNAWKNFELRFARTEVAGIISATIDVHDKRLSPLEYPKISHDRFVEPLRRGVRAVQDLGCRYIMQLGDPGGHTQTSLLPQLEDAKSASSWFDVFYGYRNRAVAMTTREVEDEVRGFAQAARRARAVGCDGIEITASKGYIIHQFLNPATNWRKDRYGGSFEARFQLLKEVVENVRKEVGRDFLFGVRLSAQVRPTLCQKGPDSPHPGTLARPSLGDRFTSLPGAGFVTPRRRGGLLRRPAPARCSRAR